jgi:hypothetical protein
MAMRDTNAIMAFDCLEHGLVSSIPTAPAAINITYQSVCRTCSSLGPWRGSQRIVELGEYTQTYTLTHTHTSTDGGKLTHSLTYTLTDLYPDLIP